MKLKALSGTLLALCFVLVMTACGQTNTNSSTSNSGANESAAAEKITLRLWYWNGADFPIQL